MENSQPTTKGALGPQCISPKSNRTVSEREMVIELERLAISYPRTDMDQHKWAALFATFYEDCRHLTLNQIQDGCRRYRQEPSNRFFPTPGQFLAACRSPFETRGPAKASYRAADDPTVTRTPEEIEALLSRTRARYPTKDADLVARSAKQVRDNWEVPSPEAQAALKREILARPKLGPWTDDEREKSPVLQRMRRGESLIAAHGDYRG